MKYSSFLLISTLFLCAYSCGQNGPMKPLRDFAAVQALKPQHALPQAAVEYDQPTEQAA